MYSRNTENNDYKIPIHYGGTAFRASQKEEKEKIQRDAVGRISALPIHTEDTDTIETEAHENFDNDNKKDGENKKNSPSFLSFLDSKEKRSSLGSDEILIATLLFLLLGNKDSGDNSALLILLLVLLV
ncbi:MAG: hypothetical protein E7671_03800 [Ruminococcaceae bacterium]|nr:hypothetical protein [Oscillospiraceae bacterium]